MSLKRDEYLLHLKRLPALASVASWFQSNIENTKMVYWKYIFSVQHLFLMSESNQSSSCVLAHSRYVCLHIVTVDHGGLTACVLLDLFSGCKP